MKKEHITYWRCFKMMVFRDNNGEFDVGDVSYNHLEKGCLMIIGNGLHIIKDIIKYPEGTYYALEVF